MCALWKIPFDGDGSGPYPGEVSGFALSSVPVDMLTVFFRRHKVFSAENVYDFCYRHLDAPPPNPIMIRTEMLEFATNVGADSIWYSG